jgi:Zn-dependent protease with chaperone function
VTAPLLLIPIALEWVVLVTTLAPVLYPGKKFMRTHPRTALAIWFGTLLSAGLAMALALGIAVLSIYDTWVTLEANPAGSQNWFLALLVSFAPWVMLAVTGVSIALINLRIEPLIASSKSITPILNLTKRAHSKFAGVKVSSVDLPFAYAFTDRREIVISNFALERLSGVELDAVLWHELGHLKHRHFFIKKLASSIRAISPTLSASKALMAEVEVLCETAADNFARQHVSEDTLAKARALFTS